MPQSSDKNEVEQKPGSDDLPACLFWKDISDYLINLCNYAYFSGRLSVCQKRDMIKLIPKMDSEPFYVKNWRSISLLNCDYKIIAKVIASCLKLSKAHIKGIVVNHHEVKIN